MFGVKTAVDDCGDAAVRVCVRGGTVEQNWDTVRSIAARLDPSSDGIVSVIPTYDALLVEFDNLLTDHDAVRALVSDAAAAPEPRWGAPRTFEIPVVYGGEYGPDLRETAQFLGVSDTEVIRLHSAAPLVMRCYGSPGGAPMLDGPAFGLPIPRRSSLRPASRPVRLRWPDVRQSFRQSRHPAVGPSSAALHSLWSIRRRSRFLSTARAICSSSARSTPIAGTNSTDARSFRSEAIPMAETITVLTPGISSVQDLGRGSASQFGQATGGAADQISAEIANALVGSRRAAPLLELTALDFAASASTDLLIAVTGAPATVTVDGHRQPQWEPIVWRAGQRLAVTGIHDGLRVYIAVHGELTADYLLGSCAPDQVLGFGHHLTAGESLVIDVDCPPIDHPVFRLPLFRLLPDRPAFGSVWTLDVTDGPDIEDFGDSAAALFDTEFVVGDQSNHIGLRLAPTDQRPLPQRTSTGEVLSAASPSEPSKYPQATNFWSCIEVEASLPAIRC